MVAAWIAAALAVALIVYVLVRLGLAIYAWTPAGREKNSNRTALEIIGACPACGDVPRHHEFATFASGFGEDPAASAYVANRLVEALIARDFERAATFQHFNGFQDGVVAYLLRCPKQRRISLLVRELSGDLASGDRWLNIEVLPEEDARRCWSLLDPKENRVLT